MIGENWEEEGEPFHGRGGNSQNKLYTKNYGKQ